MKQLITPLFSSSRSVVLCCLLSAFTCTGQGLLQEKLTDSIAVKFGHGGTEVLNKSEIIARINKLELTKNGYIVLKAYTDTVSSKAFNEALAEKRLQTVTVMLHNSKAGKLPVKTFNINETRTSGMWQRVKGVDTLFRRVDILIYGDKPKIEYNKPINLHIQFEPGTDRILPESSGSLKQLESIMKKDTSLVVQLNGHVCCEPDQPLSIKRAQSVRSWLLAAGIPSERIFCYGFGNSKPVAAETNEANRARNRRVDVVFIKKE